MSRANVANASARAEAWRNSAFLGLLRACWDLAFAHRPNISAARAANLTDIDAVTSSRAPNTGAIARWALLAALGVFLVLLASVFASCSYREEEQALAGATANLDLIASMIADNIDMRLDESPSMSPAEVLKTVLPSGALNRGQRILVSDASGAIVAAYPMLAKDGTVADQLGTSQPLTVFAEKAGVMRMVLPNGQEALATVRSLRAPLGQVAVIHGIDDVLSDWRYTLTRTRALIACVAIVLAALALAYVRQAARAREADTSCQMMRDRVDMVLARGSCGLWDWDLASGHIEWSLSMFELIGMMPRKKALTFAEVDGFIHPEDGGLNALTQSFASGQIRAIDHVFRMRGASGEWVWLRAKAEMVEGSGGSPHVIGIAIDITETMALEERTAKADMRLRDAIENVSEAFVVWDAENKLVMCNSKFRRFHNLPLDAVTVGTPYADVMERGTPPLIQSQVVLGEQQPLGARTFEAQLGDGRWLQINERRTKDGGYVSVGTDITALKRNEEQLIESERRLMNTIIDLKKSRQILETQAQQLAELAERHLEQKAEAETANRAKSDFLANMGHELRTPLNAILGFSEMMMLESLGKIGSPHYLEYSRHIHESGQHLLGVIADVLEMSRLEAGRVRLEKEQFAVGDAIAAAVASVTSVADEGHIAIGIDAQRDTKLHADRTAIEKILTILLNNAVKYTPADGRVTVRTRSVGEVLNLYVEDTGVGMPPDALARLGRPFEQLDQTLKNGMRGSGLGLAIARSLVELHGGSMRITSKEGTGTTVLINLPCRAGAPRPHLQLATASLQTSARPSRSNLQPAEAHAQKMSRLA